MRLPRRLKMAWSSLTRSAQRDGELDEELASHLAHEIEARVAAGESPARADRNARLALGNLTATAEQSRAQHSFAFLTGLGQDLSFALRLMRKSPVFTLAAVASLALGIGANTAVFSIYNRLLLDKIPVAAPNELYQLQFRTMRDEPGEFSNSLPYPFIRQIQDNAPNIAGATCATSGGASLRTGNDSRMIATELVCGNYFSLLGLRPVVGRLLQPSDNVTPGAHPVAVLAYHFWRSEYGADPGIVGRTVEINRHPFTVIGVAPRGFFSVYKGNLPNFYLPIVMDGVMNGTPTRTTKLGSHWTRILIRNKAGVLPSQLETEFAARLRAYRSVSDIYGFDPKVEATLVTRLDAAARGLNARRTQQREGKPLTVLLAVVGAILLIACINIANLLLARAAARQREIATRLALGASRGRLIRQFLTESLMLAFTGGAAGFLLALALERYLLREAYGESSLLVLGDGPSVLVMVGCLALTILAGLGFGLAPALTADRKGARTSHRMVGRKLLVSLQVALSILLLMAAGLFLKTLGNLRSVDAGFSRDNLITLQVSPGLIESNPVALQSYFRRVEDRIREVPGLAGASFSSMGVLSGDNWSSEISVAGVAIAPGSREPLRNAVGPNFFTTIGARILEGRDFVFADNSSTAPKVAVVNQSFARHYFGDSSAMGRLIGPGDRNPKPAFTIVGVVADIRDSRINQIGDKYWYIPYAQATRFASMTLTARAFGDPPSLLKLIRAEVARVDPNVPISQERTMAAQVEEQIRQERLVTKVSSFFALVAVLLAVIGLYGVLAYTVERRTKEIGIRIALGESRGQVLTRILNEALVYVGVGVAVGIPMALALAAFAEKLLYGVKPADWPTLAAAVLVIAAFGLLAGWVTARRAASIEPMAALRIE